MKVVIRTHRLDADTISGERFQIVYTYTSFNKEEIDELEEKISKQTGGAYMTVITDEDDLK